MFRKPVLKGDELFEITTDICFLINQDGIIHDVNRATIEALKYEKKEIIGLPFAKFLSDPTKTIFLKSMEVLKKDRSIHPLEIDMQTKKGDTLNLSISFSELSSNDNRDSLYFLSAHDITEQRRSQLQLLRFANAIHYSINPIEITDTQGKIIYVNPAFEKVTGYSKEELIGKNPNILSSGNQPKIFWKKMWETILSGNVWTGEIENKRKDGKIIYERLLISPIIDPSGQIVSFLGTHEDLTTQRELQAALYERQSYLTAILEDSSDAIIGIDTELRIKSWNKGAERIYGYKEEEVLNKHFSILVPPDLVKNGELERMDSMMRNFGYIDNYETERLTKYGHRILIQMSRTLIKDASGKTIGSTAIVKDVTEIRKLKRQIGHAEKLSVVGQLAAGIAHEVGNPLTSISSLVQIVQRTTADQFAKEKLELVKDQINRIAKTIRELVDFSRPSSYESIVIDLNKVIKDALNIVRYGKKSKDITFKTELDDSIPKIYLVQDQIIQVFINLLLNAVDAMDGKEGEISIHSRLDTDKICVEVIDNGKGMSNDIKEKIFEPFFTTKKVGEGTGLGLWVSYGIIKNLGGEINVKTELGKGSIFTVTIPTK